MAEWQNGIFGCFSNFNLCILTSCLPCFTTGKTAEALGMDDCFMGGCKIFIPIYNIWYLYSMRKKAVEDKGIDETQMMTCVFAICLNLCSVIQVAREAGVENPLAMGEDIQRV